MSTVSQCTTPGVWRVAPGLEVVAPKPLEAVPPLGRGNPIGEKC